MVTVMARELANKFKEEARNQYFVYRLLNKINYSNPPIVLVVQYALDKIGIR